MQQRGPSEAVLLFDRQSPPPPLSQCPTPKQQAMPPRTASPSLPQPPSAASGPSHSSHHTEDPWAQETPLATLPPSPCPAAPIPSTDGFVFGICATVYELFLYKRVNSKGGGAPPPSPWELLIVALGVGLSLIGLAWWTTPGHTYSPNRNRLMFAFRLHHLLATFLVPVAATCGADARAANALLDFVHALGGHGWIVGALTMVIFQPLPLLPTLLLSGISAALIPFTVAQSCALPFMAPLEGRIAATLRLLLRPALMTPLRGAVGMLGALGQCQVMFVTVHALLLLGLPSCLALEAWTQQGQHAQRTRRGSLHSRPWGCSVLGEVDPKALWLRLPSPLRLVAYVLGLQLGAAAVVGLCVAAVV